MDLERLKARRNLEEQKSAKLAPYIRPVTNKTSESYEFDSFRPFLRIQELRNRMNL